VGIWVYCTVKGSCGTGRRVAYLARRIFSAIAAAIVFAAFLRLLKLDAASQASALNYLLRHRVRIVHELAAVHLAGVLWVGPGTSIGLLDALNGRSAVHSSRLSHVGIHGVFRSSSHVRPGHALWHATMWTQSPRLLMLGGVGVMLLAALHLLARDNIDEEVEHVGLLQRGGNVGTLKSPTLVFLGVDPGTHGELDNEDVAALGEEDRGFGRDHLYLGIRFHDLLDASKRQLVHFVVVVLGLQLGDLILPVDIENITGLAGQALGDLEESEVDPSKCIA
jgi:hypothetical protein